MIIKNYFIINGLVYILANIAEPGAAISSGSSLFAKVPVYWFPKSGPQIRVRN